MIYCSAIEIVKCAREGLCDANVRGVAFGFYSASRRRGPTHNGPMPTTLLHVNLNNPPSICKERICDIVQSSESHCSYHNTISMHTLLDSSMFVDFGTATRD